MHKVESETMTSPAERERQTTAIKNTINMMETTKCKLLIFGPSKPLLHPGITAKWAVLIFYSVKSVNREGLYTLTHSDPVRFIQKY